MSYKNFHKKAHFHLRRCQKVILKTTVFHLVKDYNTISHYLNAKKSNFHTNVVITQNFFEH
jgi:hypothetical protein